MPDKKISDPAFTNAARSSTPRYAVGPLRDDRTFVGVDTRERTDFYESAVRYAIHQASLFGGPTGIVDETGLIATAFAGRLFELADLDEVAEMEAGE